MAYGDYVPAATLLDTCRADTEDTPGKNADCKFIGQFEDASDRIANRPHLALAENMDNMKLALDAMTSQVVWAALTGFSGSSITVDPTGGAANVSYTGYLYLGESGSYIPGTPEHYNTLFQVLDANFNKVVVDDVEVVVSTTSVAIGSGLYNGGSVTLTLSKALPSGNYILVHGRETTLATLPADALVRLGVRAIPEAPVELFTRKALTQVTAVPAFGGGSSLTIDPDAGAGSEDIIFSSAGFLYVGNSNYSGASQGDYDTLFQFMDADGNEVMFEGEEVKITGISGTTLGSGFFNGGVVTLTLGTDSTPGGVSLPSGSYKLKYARETTLGNLPDDALIAAEIRGSHEGSGENAKPSWAVCTVSGYGDFIGATALEDAIAAGRKSIYLHGGSYTMSSFALTAAEDDLTIVGEGADLVTITRATGGGVSIAADNVLIRGVTIACVDADQALLWTGSNGRVEHFDLLNMRLEIEDCSWVTFERGILGGYDRAIHEGLSASSGASNVTFKDVVARPGSTPTNPVIELQKAGHCRLENVSSAVTSGSQIALSVSDGVGGASRGVEFVNCSFTSDTGAAAQLGSNTENISFYRCDFVSDTGPAATSPSGLLEGYIFSGCLFECTTSFTSGSPFVNILSRLGSYNRSVMDRCRFVLSNVAASVASAADVRLRGFTGGDLLFDYSVGGFDGSIAKPGILLESCDLSRVRVDPGSITNGTLTALLQVGNPSVADSSSVVRELFIDSLGSDLSYVVPVRIGGSSEKDISVVDGLKLETTTSTTLVAQNSFVRMQGYSVLRRLVWDDQDISIASDNNGAIVGSYSGDVNEFITVENCHIDVTSRGAAWANNLGSGILSFNGASGSRNLTVRNNSIIDGSPGSDAISGKACIVVSEYDGVWIRGNKLTHGRVQDSGGAGPTLKTAIMLYNATNDVRRCVISDNVIESTIPNPPASAAESNFIFSDAGAYGTALTGATLIHQNILEDIGRNTTPTVGNATVQDDAAYLNFTANNVLVN